MNTKEILRYMRFEVRQPLGYRGAYILPCGEVNTTALAEAAAYELDLYGPAPDYEIPEELFELAQKVEAEVIAELECA